MIFGAMDSRCGSTNDFLEGSGGVVKNKKEKGEKFLGNG